MTTLKNILIENDTSTLLTVILKSLQTMNQYRFITAACVLDIFQISKTSMPPQLFVYSIFPYLQHRSIADYFCSKILQPFTNISYATILP